MTRKLYKHKLLLDENFPSRHKLPLLNSRYDLKHIAEDLHLAGISDKEVWKMAVKQNRILVTFNYRDFRQMAHAKNPGLIGVSTNLTNKQIDIKLTALLTKASLSQISNRYYFVKSDSR